MRCKEVQYWSDMRERGDQGEGQKGTGRRFGVIHGRRFEICGLMLLELEAFLILFLNR